MTTETTDEADTYDHASYVLSSKYRKRVMLDLVDGPTTPSQMADDNGFARSHVSRALSELGDRDLVEAHGDGSRTKLYALTDLGESVATVVEETDPEAQS